MKLDELKELSLCRSKSTNLADVKAKLRDKVPPLTHDEIRRSRMKYNDAMVAELNVAAFIDSAQLFAELDKINDSIMPNETKRHKFNTDKSTIKLIISELKSAELAKRQKRYEDQVNCLKALSLTIKEIKVEYYWIAEELFKFTLRTAIEYKMDSGRLESIVRFYYGKILTKQEKYDEAYEVLKKAWDMTKGMTWIFDEPGYSNVTREVCILLYKTIANVLRTTKENFNYKKELATLCVMVARSLKCNIAQMEANVAFGTIYMDEKYYEMALEFYKNALLHAQDTKQLPIICEANYLVACTYFELQEIENCEKYSYIIKAIAEKHHFPYYEARALLLLGKCKRALDLPQLAGDYLIQALQIFNKMGDKMMIRETRCLAAIVRGQGRFRSFVDVILKSDEADICDNIYMSKLLEWEDNRVPFWDNPKYKVEISKSKESTNISSGDIDESELNDSSSDEFQLENLPHLDDSAEDCSQPSISLQYLQEQVINKLRIIRKKAKENKL